MENVSRTIKLIVIHCSATQNGSNILPDDIDFWHSERGFLRKTSNSKNFNPDLPHIGYHNVITLDGKVFNGRQYDEVGAHVRGHNRYSIGICLIGTNKFTYSQWITLSLLVQNLKKSYQSARVLGHRDLSPDHDGDGKVEPHEWLKTCPGFDVASWIQRGFAPLPENILNIIA